MKKNRASVNKRLIFLLIFFLLLSLIIVVRLFYVQIIKSKEYTKMALEQMTRSEEIISDRGYIYDRNGKKLAVNMAASTVYVNPQNYEGETLGYVAKELAPLVEIDEGRLVTMFSKGKRVKVKQWVDREVAMRISEKNLDGVELVEGFRRFYPFAGLGSHLLGFINVDGVGQYGVEASYNKELSGTPGRLIKSSDMYNRKLPTKDSAVFDADDGLSAILTIDQGVQSYIEEESKKILNEFQAEKVHIIVQEVETGDILGMETYPSFNPNDPTSPITDMQAAKWDTLSYEDVQNEWYKNWRNPVVSDMYEPGSTFKLITTAIALEENTSDPNKKYYCTGYIRDIKNAPPLKCVSYENPHGDITLNEALAKSCNPSFVYVNREIGRENFVKYIKAFGFGEKTDIDLPGEGIGIIPTNPEDISELSLATMSYGHGLAVTPIQLINVVSAIGNDGILMTPRVVKEFVNSQGQRVKSNEIAEKRQILSEETSRIMLDMMANVIEEGTGKRAQSGIYRIGGKTGTANKVSESGGYEPDQYVSSFVGLAPIDDPKIAVLVIVDSPKTESYGSIVAAPSGKNIIEYTLNAMGVEEDRILGPGEEARGLVKTPNLRYKLIEQAGEIIVNRGLKYTTEYVNITDDTIVIDQKPGPGELIEKGGIVEVQVDLNNGEEKILPNFLGLTVEEAGEILSRWDIEYEVEEKEDIEGDKIIIETSPEFSNTISPDEKVVLILGKVSELEDDNLDDPGLVDGLLEVENTENREIENSEETDNDSENDDSN